MSFHPYRRRLFLSVLLPYSLFLRLPFCPAPLLPPAHAAVNPADLDALKQLFRPKPTAACIFPSEGPTCQSAERSVHRRGPAIRAADSPQRPENQPPLLLGRIWECEGAEVAKGLAIAAAARGYGKHCAIRCVLAGRGVDAESIRW
ncbi:MAG: hypothetical protein COZ56_20080 [Armatimonadetes bacterium CG_4_8_14_3_um_filter_58_9]|nr:MAG: hypothetical protein COZ56_20080 [Armatimonadetes bacterium CG_4_8_14_3_um_filter_58_9]PJB62942.1 MAG: hypothetical protein CO095_17530 [Armatimonadetes bacterium CG_4_9_14_3_um_filter_58_7]